MKVMLLFTGTASEATGDEAEMAAAYQRIGEWWGEHAAAGTIVGGDTKMRQMFTLLEDVACQRCGAILAGFAYRVPADSFTSMSPGTGAADLDDSD